MAGTEATATAKKERAADRRLQREFGITLADRNQRAKDQEYKCKICGGPLDAFGPAHLDHYHFRVKAYRVVGDCAVLDFKWFARGFDEAENGVCTKWARTKAQAIADVKREMMPWSIRALLCAKCNRGLGYVERFFGAAKNPDILFRVAAYLQARLK
jgi:hypothetical protein